MHPWGDSKHSLAPRFGATVPLVGCSRLQGIGGPIPDIMGTRFLSCCPSPFSHAISCLHDILMWLGYLIRRKCTTTYLECNSTLLIIDCVGYAQSTEQCMCSTSGKMNVDGIEVTNVQCSPQIASILFFCCPAATNSSPDPNRIRSYCWKNISGHERCNSVVQPTSQEMDHIHSYNQDNPCSTLTLSGHYPNSNPNRKPYPKRDLNPNLNLPQ